MEFTPDFIAKLKKQDHNAFNEFYLKTIDMFFRYINANYRLPAQDAEDIIWDFYVKRRDAIKNHDDKQSFTWYFRTIFKNTIKDHFKKNTDTPFTELESTYDERAKFEDTLIDGNDLTEFLEHDYKFDQIQKAMKELDDTDKDIVYRKFIEEKSYEEISFLLWISQDTVRQRLSRAIKRLKELLN